jgi:PAS domain S-box-containing protein
VLHWGVLSTLLEISRSVTSTLELQPLLGQVLDQLQTIVESRRAAIMLVEGDELCVAEYRGEQRPEQLVGMRFPSEQALIFQAVLRADGPVIVDDLMGPSALADAYRAGPGKLEVDPLVGAQRSVLAVPLKVKNRIIGQVRLDHDQPGFYSPRDADLVLAVAFQAAIAIENARLFEEAERRRRELEALYFAEGALHRSLRREDVLEALVEVAAELLNSDKTSVLVWDEHHEALVVGAAQGFSPEAVARMRHGPGEGISWYVATGGQPIAVDDVAADSRVAHHIVDPEGVRSLLHVPIKIGAEVVGVFGINYLRLHHFTADEERLLVALAQRAGLALENANLFEDEQQLRGRLEVALEAGQMRTWDWELRTNVVTWSPQLEAIHGLVPGEFVGTFEGFFSDVHPEDRERVRQALAASLERGEHHLEYRIVWPDGSIHWLEATGRVVKDARGQTTGLRGVCQDVTARKQAEVERNRLLEREKAAWRTAAALEERQRLARELHDSVAQALYGMSLATQTILAELAEGPDIPAATDAATYVLNLAQAAIAEMRALIFELRPDSLQQEGLVAALERHATAAGARHALQVDARLGSEPDLPLEQKEAVYRIAQEALHNVVKHAHAHHVSLRLEEVDGRVVLEVSDDGIGFEPTASYPGHFGLIPMRERAAGRGGQLTIAWAPGQGARLTLML